MAEDWKRLLAGIATRSVNLAEGEMLFRAGDDALSLFHLERGSVRLSRHGITLHHVEPGSLFAESGLFAAAHDCDCVAECSSVVEIFPKSAVLLHLSAHPTINLAFSAYLARQVRMVRGLLEVLRLKSARERVLAYLTVKGAVENEIRLTQPLTAIAAKIGLTHEALYRTLAVLKKEGVLIRRDRRLFRLIQHGK